MDRREVLEAKWAHWDSTLQSLRETIRIQFRAIEEKEAAWPSFAEQIERNRRKAAYLDDAVFVEMEERAKGERLLPTELDACAQALTTGMIRAL